MISTTTRSLMAPLIVDIRPEYFYISRVTDRIVSQEYARQYPCNVIMIENKGMNNE